MLRDSATGLSAYHASVAVLHAGDSMLMSFGRADDAGVFMLEVDSAGSYLLLVEHPQFASLVYDFEVNKAETDLGEIHLLDKDELMKEVVVTDKRAIIIRGDTTEYTADSFKTEQYDNVSALLKKLPGIEVDKNGKIKAYGQEVKKMLVDGEEFFSDDPAMVAEMLRASSVDKVQVYDKKSEQAQYTGVDDGEKVKTINLTLKEDAKKGYIGKVALGGGTNQYYQNQAMLQAYKNKRKAALYVTHANTMTSGLGYSDASTYGAGTSSGGVSSDGFFYSYSSDDDDVGSWTGTYQGQGLPRSVNGGAQYANKWKGDSLSFSGSAKHQDYKIEQLNNNFSKYILPDTQYVTQSSSSSTNTSVSNKVAFTSQYKVDSLTDIRLSGNIGFAHSTTEEQSAYQAHSSDGSSLLSNSTTDNHYDGHDKKVSGALFVARRFKKKGRSVSLQLNGKWSDATKTGNLLSHNDLYAIDTFYSINQRKDNQSTVGTLDANFIYTEPITAQLNLNVNYDISDSRNQSRNLSYDQLDDNGQPSDVYNPLYSSNYDYNYFTNKGGLSLSYNTKHIFLNAGASLANTHFYQKDLVYDTVFSYNRLNFFPRLSFRYKAKGNRNFTFSYSGSTSQPTIQQISPYQVNTDPMNISVGNPDLKQSFSHSFNMGYNSYNVLKKQYLYFYSGGNIQQNGISQRQNIDISGRNIYQYVNMSGNMSFYGMGGFQFYVLKKIGVSPGLRGSYSRNKSYLNGLLNVTDVYEVQPELRLDYYSDNNKYNLSYTFSPAYNSSVSSIRSDIKTNYWLWKQTLDGHVNLPLGFTFNVSIDWQIRQKLDAADNHNKVFRLDMYMGKRLLKDKSLEVRASVNDLFNQNIGYNRNTTNSVITETNYNTIRRYGLLQLIWNFTSQKSKTPQSDEE